MVYKLNKKLGIFTSVLLPVKRDFFLAIFKRNCVLWKVDEMQHILGVCELSDLVFILLTGIYILWCAFFFFIWVSLKVWSIPLNAQSTVGSIGYWKYNILLGWNIKEEGTCKSVCIFSFDKAQFKWAVNWRVAKALTSPTSSPEKPWGQITHWQENRGWLSPEHENTHLQGERVSTLWIFMHFVQLLLNIEHEHSLVQELKPHFSSSWVTAQVIRLQGHSSPQWNICFTVPSSFWMV